MRLSACHRGNEITERWTILSSLLGIVVLVSCSPHIDLFSSPTQAPPPGFLSVDNLVPGTFFSEPSFSTDGRLVALGAHESPQQIEHIDSFYVIDLRSRTVHFRSSEGLFLGGTLSPDGKRMAVTSGAPLNDPSPSGVLFLIDISTNQEGQHTRGFLPAWSSNSRQIAFAHVPDRFAAEWELQIRVRDTATGQEETAYSTVINEGYHISDITWSPDNRKLAFAMETTGLNGNQSWPDLYILDVENRSIRQITTNHYVISINFSPDGNKILYLADATPEELGGIHLFVIDLERNCHRIPNQPVLDNTREIILSPNGERVAFATGYSGVFVAETKDALGDDFWNAGEPCE